MKYLGRTNCHFCRGTVSPVYYPIDPLFGRYAAQCVDCKAQYLILHFRNLPSDLCFLSSGSTQPYSSDLPRYRVVRDNHGKVYRSPSPTCDTCANLVDYHDYCWTCHRYLRSCTYCQRPTLDRACACDVLDDCA